MTQLIADRLLAMPAHLATPDRRVHIERAQSMLRMPSEESGDTGKIDRFVAPPGLWDHLLDDWETMDAASRIALRASIKSPLPQFWLESAAMRHGFLFDGDRGTVWAHFANAVLPIATFDLDVIRRGAGHLSDVLEDGAEFFKHRPHEFRLMIVTVGNVLAAIGSRRATSLKRNQVTQSQAKRAFRAGRPRFSYQQVDLIIPRTCIFRDEVHDVRALEAMRGHMVIGHWRLIDGAIEPFWRWIEGHERGDRERGWIIKQRNLVYVGGSRRGFLLPEQAGEPGERRLAVRA
jgi:hypothetical protein